MITPSANLEALAIKKIRRPSASVYIKWDGTNWTDETDRLKNVTGFEEMGGGLFETGSGEIDLEFYNEDYHFTLGHENCVITEEQMVPKRLVKVDIGFGDYHLTRFYGYIDKYKIDPKSGTFAIHGFDRSYILKTLKSGYVFFEDKTITELMTWLAEFCGLTSAEYNIEETSEVIKFAYFEDRTVWFLMNRLAEAEGGRVFFDNNNILQFWNRSHLSFTTTPAFEYKYDDYIMGQPYEISDKDIKNKIRVRATSREVMDEEVIWDFRDESDEFGRVRAYNDDSKNDTTFNVTLENPVTSFVRPLVAYTDYEANTAKDGSGSDLTTDIEFIQVGTFLRGLLFQIRYNASSGIAYFTKFQVRGTPAKIYSIIDVTLEDEASQALFGVREKEVENPYIDDVDFATSIAQLQLNMFSKTLSDFYTETVAIPWIVPGDVVAVQIRPEAEDTETYLVVSTRWSWTPGSGATMTMRLAVNYTEIGRYTAGFGIIEGGEGVESGVVFDYNDQPWTWGESEDNDTVWNIGHWGDNP